MSRLFAALANENTPKLNPVVMDGLSTYYIPKCAEYLDSIIKSVSKSFPQGLTYHGYERCSPLEEFEETTRHKGVKRTFDLARSDIYLVKYFFAFEGQPLPTRYIYLPFVNTAGTFYISGALYHMTPVLSDKVISPQLDSVFVKLVRDKLIFKRCYHSIVVNGMREMKQIVWSAIYRKTTKVKVTATTGANTTVAHYLFAKYGVTDTFKKYCGFKPIYGTSETITVEKYPKNKYVICESTKIKPSGFKQKFYEPSDLRMAIPISHWNTHTESLVSGFFYVVDHFPNRITVEAIDNTSIWMILLGHIIFTGHFSEGKLYQNVDEHFISLSEYIDFIVIEQLKQINYHIENFYDLLDIIVKDFNEIVIRSSTTASNSVYNKTFDILSYVLFDIISGINRTNFKLNKMASKKKLNFNDVMNVFTSQLKMGAIYKLSSGKVVAAGASYSGDHKYPKLTAIVSEQETVQGTRAKKSHKSLNERNRIHTSQIEIGSLLYLPKRNPTPVVRINPCVQIDLQTGSIVPNEKLRPVLEKTQAMLKEISYNSTIDQSVELTDEDDDLADIID